MKGKSIIYTFVRVTMYAAYESKFTTWISINRRRAIMSREIKDLGKHYQ